MAESGPESIRLAAEQQFDLVLMDVRMPGMGGLEATQRIRALPGAHGQMPILALTAHAFPHEVARCKDAGMDGHLPKPIDYETLIKAVEQAVRRVSPPLTVGRPASPPTDLSTAARTASAVGPRHPGPAVHVAAKA